MEKTITYYDRNAVDFAAGIVSVDCAATQDRFLRRLPKQAVILDFGFGGKNFLSAVDKAGLFKFRVDDNGYNLELHGLVLKKLGVCLYGSQLFEDYQSIYW